MFGREVIGECSQSISRQIIQFNAGLCVKVESLKCPPQHFILPFLGFGDIVDLNEMCKG